MPWVLRTTSVVSTVNITQSTNKRIASRQLM